MGVAIDFVKIMFGFLTPPEVFEWYAVRRWCVKSSITLGVIGLTLGTFIGLAFGTVGVFGFTGFAYASELKDTKQQIVAMRVEGLEDQIMNFQDKRCAARKTGNEDATKLYDRLIIERQKKHRELSDGLSADIQPC